MKNKNILITGSEGFIGFNLKIRLIEKGFNVLEFKKKNSLLFLKKQIQNSNFIFHLAGTNRSKKKKEYEDNNVNLTSNICKFILDTKKKIPIFFSSTTQINNKNSYYSKTKLQGENIIKFYLIRMT